MNKPVRILIVEDSEDDAKLSLRALRGGGFEPTHRRVQTAVDLTAALVGERWDAVISDFAMPGFTGMDALRIFRGAGLDIPFILISGTVGEDTAVQAMKAGASDYLMKQSLTRLAPVLERELKETQMRAAHRQAQEALADSETRFRQMAENIRDVFFLDDAVANRMLYVSPAYEEIWGRSCESLYANPDSWGDAIHPDDRASTFEKYNKEMPTGNFQLQYRIVRPDGSIRWIEARGFPIHDTAGKLVRIAGIATDISERKESEEVLRRFVAAMDAIADGIFLTDRSTMSYLYVNDAACRLQNLTREELLALGPMKLLAKSRAEVERDYDAVIDGGVEGEPIELLWSRPDGSPLWVELRRHALRSGDRWTIVTLVRDITARKQAAQDLRESERRFSDLLQNVGLISVMLDREARITYCNEYLLRLTGWQHEEVIGHDWFELFLPPESVDAKEVFGAVLANLPNAWHHENEILTRSGERRLIRWNNSVLRSAMGDVIGTASIGEDITEEKQNEIKIRRLNRVHAVLSGINTLIVREHDRDALFREACRIAVEQGGFRMTWIGLVDPKTMELVPVAAAGTTQDASELVNQRFSLLEPAPRGNTLSARAVRDKTPVFTNDVPNDPAIVFKDEHAKRGSRSMAILPLMVAGEAVGVLALYAEETGFFDEAELKLLTELAGDIAFAIDHIGKEAKLNYLAYYDPLTGLANRTLFIDRVAQHMRSALTGGHQLAVFLIDLERFKNINDSLGRSAGDALLRQMAEWLTSHVEDASLVARVGADHFVVVLPKVEQDCDVARHLETTMEALAEHPFHLNDSIFRITARVGIALFPDDGADAETLFRNAEAALKLAKASGERYLFYTRTMTATGAAKLSLENQLRQALDNGEFVLHYQPKVNLASGKLVGAEALIRWNDPRTGLVPPGRFIPILEETGLIYEVGRWALRQAIADYLRWRAAGLPAVRIAVNVSPLQLRNRGFVDEIRQVIGIDAQAAAGLELEITESLIMDDVKHNIASLQAIRDMGISIAIDDFGTGFSSLSYLARLPVDTLKIDRSFVIDMTLAPEGLALVSTIINLAHSLKLKVVAEGVETEEQQRLLHLLNCDEMQGFLFSKPLPGDIFEARYLALAAAVPP